MTAPVDALANGVIENLFTVVGGNIDKSNTNFFGFINGNTGLSFNTSIASGSTFLDLLNTFDFGASGVLDADSSTLTYSSAATPVPFEFSPIPGLVLLGGGLAWRRFSKHQKTA
ncbi:hypothetical protein VB711_11680 [Cronbergia sp. UHCC 0137]|uniref:PFE-CTERM domain-containing protein n=1 Tax=Cronbergia sp. UHCC 0137 TaxID=3110239 RepID=UPI002B21AA08|nr:hypothetical protein [Cronbergia sp. UHCC 0137]MEA5618490.1 hypothetical protein [Cronbergia sp. UHCC 0137]